MQESTLPAPISHLVDGLLVHRLVWQGVEFHLPKFAVYALLVTPVFDHYIYRNGRKLGLLKFGRYQVPVVDPFKGDLEPAPDYVAVVSHTKGNQFGLYGYPADFVEDNVYVPYQDKSIKRIVKDFV